ncbi:hypothetical protein EZV62_023412 [Acer yangbiense]|uniref:Uncharacterized protein n=1 Tax=Acer yangbiense TaxID=1000413 RepID=A0A5C7H1N6_9ROSI|nr:hypothetical protein EZV62_023412 [Acer yangbiense]
MSTNNLEEGDTTAENSALARRRVVDNKKSQDKEKLWCDYCHKQRHTRAMCWKLHGKPQNLKQFVTQGGLPPNQSGHANQITTVTGNHGQSADRLNQMDVERLKQLLNQLDSPNTNTCFSTFVTGSCSMASSELGGDRWVLSDGPKRLGQDVKGSYGKAENESDRATKDRQMLGLRVIGEMLKVFENSGSFWVGVVITDDKGVIVMADALSWFGRVSVEVAAAKAILEGLLFAERNLKLKESYTDLTFPIEK